MQTCTLSPNKQFPKPSYSSANTHQKHIHQTQTLSKFNPQYSSSQNTSPPIKRLISNKFKIVHLEKHSHKPPENTPINITFKIPANQIQIKHSFKSPITIKQISNILQEKYSNIGSLQFYQNQSRLFSQQIISKSTQIRVYQKLIHLEIKSEDVRVFEFKIDSQLLKMTPLDLMNSLCSSSKLQKHKFAYYDISGEQYLDGLRIIPFNKKINLMLTNNRSQNISIEQTKQTQTNDNMIFPFSKLFEQLRSQIKDQNSCDPEFQILKYRLRKAFQSEDQNIDQKIMRYIKEWLVEKF